MPVSPSHYPPGWRPFSDWVRFTRAQGRCECHGLCGLHPPNPNPRRCVERHHHQALFFSGRVVLTTAHICSCSPVCLTASHVLATCQRCHLRIDAALHAAHRATTTANKNDKTLPWHPGLGWH